MAAEVEIIVSATDNTSGVLGNIAKAGFAVLATAVATLGTVMVSSVQSAMESQNVIADLEATLKSTGGAAGLTSQQLQDMATQLQNVTKFSDETIIKGEAMLLTFTNIGGDVFPAATEAMLNLAEKFGSVDSASVQLGKALNDPIAGISALTRVGVTFSDEQKNTIKALMDVGDTAGAQKVILAELDKEFGGLAEAAGKTFAGQMEIAKNKLDTLKETIGNALLPILTTLLGKFSDFATSPEVLKFVQDFSIALQKAVLYLESFDLTRIQKQIVSWYTDAGGAMGIYTSIQNAVSNIDWAGISQAFADGVSKIDWVKVGSVIRAALGVMVAALNLAGILIEDFIRKTDWGAVSKALGNALAGIVAGALGYVNWDALMVDFKNGFVYIGQQALTGLASAFGYDSFARFADDFKRGFNYIITSVKNFLGISSPSTVFASIGRNIVLGLIAGWDDTIGQFITAIGITIEKIGKMFGIDLSGLLGGSSASGLGTAGGGTGTSGGTTGTGAGGGTSGGVVNNYYGPVYFQGGAEVGSYYDCPSPNPLVAMSGNQLVVGGF